MTPLEIMAAANYEAESGDGSWDLVSELSQKKLMQYMRAALLALAEAELPNRMEFQRGKETVILHPNNGCSKALFRKFCHAIANEGGGDGNRS
jgi:hypothetical protein